jgi:hypothetical protein
MLCLASRQPHPSRAELTFDPHVSASGDGEDEEKSDEKEALKVVGCDSLGGEDHGPDELTLSRPKPGPQHDSQATLIRSYRVEASIPKLGICQTREGAHG